jgi:hypothetical protein
MKKAATAGLLEGQRMLSATRWLRLQKAQLLTLKQDRGSCERCPVSDQLP